jgi:hypothetical protein
MAKRFGVMAVFLAGCAVGGASSQLVVPRASAQQAASLTRWEYYYVEWRETGELYQIANKLGAEGWELAEPVVSQGRQFAWFKRAKM